MTQPPLYPRRPTLRLGDWATLAQRPPPWRMAGLCKSKAFPLN